MCVAMVIIHTKTLEKKAVDDVTSTESLQLHEPPTMSQGTALFSCGIMESGRWPEVCVQQRAVGSSLESLWDSVRETGASGGISGLLRDLSLSEAPSSGSTAPPSKRQCRSLSCSEALGGRSSWRPQGSRVWTSVEKRRCLSGGSVQRGAFAPAGFPSMQRSSSFSLPTHSSELPEPFSFSASPQSLYLSQERVCPAESSPDSTPELQRRTQGLARSQSQPCVHNLKKSGVKRRRPADSHKHRPSLDLLKMTQLQDFHSLSCPGITGEESDPTLEQAKDHAVIHQSEASWAVGRSNGKERECLWAGLCSRRGRDSFQLGGELDIEQIERN
ncbi:protein FAM53B isoform X2 [Puntigrus tetrazona]|uniref:protein FAM53B isoform X2 n=1 Tax=Puntigrus tetrazona TaxID=1606681 RepID=UPI001C89C1C6|nr:protein FAM53B isoform X2 [Puntigrus tetrazona]